MDTLLEIFLDTISDTWSVLPFLLLIYCWIEGLELFKWLQDLFTYLLQKHGPLLGATLGLLPQCGFSIVATLLYLKDEISYGTLISVFIAISDEALPILLSEPSIYPSIAWLLIIKWVLAFGIGSLFNLFTTKHLSTPKPVKKEGQKVTSADIFHVFMTAVYKTLKIYALVFVSTFILSLLINLIGVDKVSSLLLSGSFYQPLLTALLGLIPNCALAIIFSQLYILGEISFASLCAGLISNAGLGLFVFLFKSPDKKKVLYTLILLFLIALGTGFILEILPAVF